jgi:recombination protein RecR
MAKYLPKSVEKVIDEFERLPGVGPKSAARLVYHFLRSPNRDASRLSEALKEMDEKVKFCNKCFNVSEQDICEICDSPLRDQSKLCIVEEPLDVVAFEKTGLFNGFYFVLGGVISPADGIGAEELRFNELESRVNEIQSIDSGNSIGMEVISAMNPSLEGEATTAYIKDLFSAKIESGEIELTRLAMGLPTGADLEYADRLTLKRALEGRS